MRKRIGAAALAASLATPAFAAPKKDSVKLALQLIQAPGEEQSETPLFPTAATDADLACGPLLVHLARRFDERLKTRLPHAAWDFESKAADALKSLAADLAPGFQFSLTYKQRLLLLSDQALGLAGGALPVPVEAPLFGQPPGKPKMVRPELAVDPLTSYFRIMAEGWHQIREKNAPALHDASLDQELTQMEQRFLGAAGDPAAASAFASWRKELAEKPAEDFRDVRVLSQDKKTGTYEMRAFLGWIHSGLQVTFADPQADDKEEVVYGPFTRDTSDAVMVQFKAAKALDREALLKVLAKAKTVEGAKKALGISAPGH